LTAFADFSVAYARLLPPVRAKCRRLLGAGPGAEDVAQETFLRFWRSGISADCDARTAMAWLYRTSTRLAIDALRERRAAISLAPLVEQPCGLDLAASVEARAAIVTLTASVPRDELEVAVLCRVDGLAQPEAATVLGISERTVRRMLDRFDERTVPLRREIES
jgi:RNA polymerase sigma-70 factor (ECF subfamily)